MSKPTPLSPEELRAAFKERLFVIFGNQLKLELADFDFLFDPLLHHHEAVLEAVREKIEARKAQAEKLEGISSSFATKGAIANCNDLLADLDSLLPKKQGGEE